MSRGFGRLSTALFISLYALSTCAASSIDVALKASFNAAPYLVELLETAAEENSTAYFPLLDRIADGAFEQTLSDKELHDTFLRILQEDGHITSSEAISSFEFALAIRSAAPRIEAHYQYYNTSVKASLPGSEECESWVYFDGKQYCTPDLAEPSAVALSHDVLDLPFDRILGDSSSGTPSIVYADITSPSFGTLHKTISLTAKSGKTSYRVRYKPSLSAQSTPLIVSGYGVGLDLKRTDYIVIDDREAGEGDGNTAKSAGEASLAGDEAVADLKPLSSSELKGLANKAASFVMNSANPLDTLLKLTGDFPKHSAAIAATNVSDEFRKEHLANRDVFLPPGYNVVWINGVQTLARDFEAFALLERLRNERKLINGAKELGLTGENAISLLSHQLISDAFQNQEPQRYDWRDIHEGGNVIMWLNDIEKDKRYEGWPIQNRALLQRTFPGQLPSLKKDVHNLIVPIDFSDYKDVQLVVENLQSFVKRKVPIRFGLVPKTTSAAASEQAKVVYHLLDTYGLGALLTYLERSFKGQGRNLSSPSQSYFDQAVKDRTVRRDRTVAPFQEVLSAEQVNERISAAQSYLDRLHASDANSPIFANGIAIPRTDDWLQVMSNRVGMDLRIVQEAVYKEVVDDDAWLPDLFLATASLRRNPYLIPEDDKDAKHMNLAAVPGIKEGFIGSVPGIPADLNTVDVDLVHLVLTADYNSPRGWSLLSEAVAFWKEHKHVELFLVHNTGVQPEAGLSTMLYNAIQGKSEIALSDIEQLTSSQAIITEEDAAKDAVAAHAFWASAKPLLDAAGLVSGEAGIILNGRVVGPIPSSASFNKDDLAALLIYEEDKRLIAAAGAIDSLGLTEKASTPLAFAKLSNLIALSTVSDVPEGIFESAPTLRVQIFEKWKSAYTAIETGDKSTASIQIVAALDPASENAQRWVPILKVLSELSGVHMRIFLNPKDRLEELPVKRFYRHVLSSAPRFNADGSLQSVSAHFSGLPAEALLTMAMDTPPSWLVAPSECVQDLDNIKLSSLKGSDINAVYELESILIEGHSRDVTLGPPPRGAQLVLGTEGHEHIADTIIMANLGYFQFKANPGFYNLTLQKGRSAEIFHLDSAGSKGYAAQPGDESTEVALISFRGLTLFPRLSRRPGMEDEDVLEPPKTMVDEIAAKTDRVLSKVGLSGVKSGEVLSKAQKLGSSLFHSGNTATTDVSTLPHADINIFSVASGHLYERMLNIMMVSVMKHTTHSVKFWFIEQFLSPSFKASLPALAAEYNFRYEMVTYKWPHWLRSQKEKQREIWGYKILFLDVLFPLDLNKVIFVDADQIVRTDMYSLVTHDLQGAPYGFTPMCDSRVEMEGFRFWKQGYWKNFLRGKPYHISALYVVDLQRFRAIAAGDRLRQQYHQLSADPQSLSNLDQDLPNHMQHMLPIHSLPQHWLWCETWCSDESLADARTIDLCNNPQTKEPKLERARRQLPEWTVYDDEIAAVLRRARGEGAAVEGGVQAELQEEEARAHRRRDEL